MRKKILFIGNTGLVINSFLKGYILELARDYDVNILYNFKSEPANLKFPENISLIHYDIKRKYSFSDFYFLLFLCRFFRSTKIYATISITPKVGFIVNLAAYFAGVNKRIHFFTGQIWINSKGLRRIIFKYFDKMLFSLATYRFIDSPSQYDFLRKEGFCVNINTFAVKYGSICGVDINRFQKNIAIRNKIRESLKINDQVVLLYIGRKDIDKGIVDLINAFEKIDRKDISLLLVGPDEMNLDLVLKRYKSADRIISIGMTIKPEDYYSAGDIFCYLSYREGFGLSVVEASACELPVIGTDIVGLRDAVANNETGFLIHQKNQKEIQGVIKLLVDNSELRKYIGSKGRSYVIKRFKKEFVENEYIALLKNIISNK
jgi:glycosyltransferase involved in cell wall biosynthesis